MISAVYFTAMFGLYTLTFWMPQLIKAVGKNYSKTIIGLLVMVPYVFALTTMILVGRSSDRSLERRYHGAIPIAIGALCFGLLTATGTTSVFLLVALWALTASGINSFLAPFWSLPNQFLTGYAAAAGIALINCFGNLGGFLGPYAMGAMIKSTGSFRAGLVLAGASWLISAALLIALPGKTEAQTQHSLATKK